MSKYWGDLLPNMPGSSVYQITCYGNILKNNKVRLLNAFKSSAIGANHCALMIAMAMIETNYMSPAGRDATKDKNSDKSANASIFNLSEDMLNELGYRGNIHILDSLASLSNVVRLINNGLQKWGVVRMLNFVRGGRTAFVDGVSYGAWNYRNAVATILRLIDMYPALMSDDRRVEINVKHV